MMEPELTTGTVKRESKLKSDEGIKVQSSEFLQVYPSFESMGLKEELLRGIYCYGFDKPSAVQQRAIIPITSSRDVIVQSQSGTGKTAVFCLGALQRI